MSRTYESDQPNFDSIVDNDEIARLYEAGFAIIDLVKNKRPAFNGERKIVERLPDSRIGMLSHSEHPLHNFFFVRTRGETSINYMWAADDPFFQRRLEYLPSQWQRRSVEKFDLEDLNAIEATIGQVAIIRQKEKPHHG